MSAAAPVPPLDPFARADARAIRAAELRSLYNFWQGRHGIMRDVDHPPEFLIRAIIG